jgi:periplasmic protein TonB
VAATADIWTEQDRLSTPLWASVVLHGGLFAALVFGGLLTRSRGEDWGGTGGGGGGAMSATMVSTIPLPSKAPNQNVLANESKGLSQTQPKVEETPPPEAIAIPAPNAKKAPKQQTLKQPKVSQEILQQANNIVPFGAGGPAGNLYSTFSASTGTGGIGVSGGDFGSRFSSYVDSVRRRISETWFMYEVDPSAAGRRVYVTFDILKDGSHTDAVIEQPSGVPTLDISAKRTIARIDRFAPLPNEYNGRSVSVEFYFEYTGKH